MTLQMFGARFRQWLITTEGRGKRDFIVLWPEKNPMPAEVQQYMEADWACNRISLLDFLRKTTDKGKICKWLIDLHTRADTRKDLEDFAADYCMQGEKVVLADVN